jgi:hypothetical protein
MPAMSKEATNTWFLGQGPSMDSFKKAMAWLASLRSELEKAETVATESTTSTNKSTDFWTKLI